MPNPVQELRDAEALAEQEADEKAAAELGAVAIYKIRYANRMTEEGKLAIVEWLRHLAIDLLDNGHEYAELFTATYNKEDEVVN